MKKIIQITDKNAKTSGIIYWKDKSFKERMEALEFLRQQYINNNHVPERLQRVITIIRKK